DRTLELLAPQVQLSGKLPKKKFSASSEQLPVLQLRLSESTSNPPPKGDQGPHEATHFRLTGRGRAGGHTTGDVLYTHGQEKTAAGGGTPDSQPGKTLSDRSPLASSGPKSLGNSLDGSRSAVAAGYQPRPGNRK